MTPHAFDTRVDLIAVDARNSRQRSSPIEALARVSHAGQRTRFGEPVIEHVKRVAAAVPPEARRTALLHEILELNLVSRRELWDTGLSRVELAALELLTHSPDDSYEVYVRQITDAPGQAGHLARIVKLADLDDHLSHPTIPPDAPPYAWARQRLLTGPRSRDPADTRIWRLFTRLGHEARLRSGTNAARGIVTRALRYRASQRLRQLTRLTPRVWRPRLCRARTPDAELHLECHIRRATHCSRNRQTIPQERR
jgi:hypothetical protein